MMALDQAQRGIEDCLDALSFDTGTLEETEERLFAIRGLARKHDVLPDDLANFAQELRERLAVVDDSGQDLHKLQRAVDAARTAYDAAADALGAARRAAAASLDAAMAKELAPLKMDRAVFSTAFEPIAAGPDGKDAVAFHVATNPGAPSGPLNKIASGGELSRFLLALKVCLTDAESRITMIFDEIDRGVGGATADAVGQRLADLARSGQVLVVTHSPQVAAKANQHWRVEKNQTSEETISRVVALDQSARIEELARMISGDRITQAARAAAAELMSPK